MAKLSLLLLLLLETLAELLCPSTTRLSQLPPLRQLRLLLPLLALIFLEPHLAQLKALAGLVHWGWSISALRELLAEARRVGLCLLGHMRLDALLALRWLLGERSLTGLSGGLDLGCLPGELGVPLLLRSALAFQEGLRAQNHIVGIVVHVFQNLDFFDCGVLLDLESEHCFKRRNEASYVRLARPFALRGVNELDIPSDSSRDFARERVLADGPQAIEGGKGRSTVLKIDVAAND